MHLQHLDVSKAVLFHSSFLEFFLHIALLMPLQVPPSPTAFASVVHSSILLLPHTYPWIIISSMAIILLMQMIPKYVSDILQRQKPLDG